MDSEKSPFHLGQTDPLSRTSWLTFALPLLFTYLLSTSTWPLLSVDKLNYGNEDSQYKVTGD